MKWNDIKYLFQVCHFTEFHTTNVCSHFYSSATCLPLRPTYSQNHVSVAAVWSKEVIRSSQLSLTMCHRRLLVVRSYLMIQVRAACDQVPHSQSFSLQGIVQIKRNSVHGNRWDSSSTLTQIHSIWLTVESFVKSNQLPSCIHFF